MASSRAGHWWIVGLATVIPWLPVFTLDVTRTYHRYQWLTLLYVIVVTQSGHFLEHEGQMIQIHVLRLTGADARGIFGTLDIEWVHFVWNTWVLLAVVVLLWRFRANRWLWLTELLSSSGCGMARSSRPSIPAKSCGLQV